MISVLVIMCKIHTGTSCVNDIHGIASATAADLAGQMGLQAGVMLRKDSKRDRQCETLRIDWQLVDRGAVSKARLTQIH